MDCIRCSGQVTVNCSGRMVPMPDLEQVAGTWDSMSKRNCSKHFCAYIKSNRIFQTKFASKEKKGLTNLERVYSILDVHHQRTSSLICPVVFLKVMRFSLQDCDVYGSSVLYHRKRLCFNLSLLNIR